MNTFAKEKEDTYKDFPFDFSSILTSINYQPDSQRFNGSELGDLVAPIPSKPLKFDSMPPAFKRVVSIENPLSTTSSSKKTLKKDIQIKPEDSIFSEEFKEILMSIFSERKFSLGDEKLLLGISDLERIVMIAILNRKFKADLE